MSAFGSVSLPISVLGGCVNRIDVLRRRGVVGGVGTRHWCHQLIKRPRESAHSLQQKARDPDRRPPTKHNGGFTAISGHLRPPGHPQLAERPGHSASSNRSDQRSTRPPFQGGIGTGANSHHTIGFGPPSGGAASGSHGGHGCPQCLVTLCSGWCVCQGMVCPML